MTQAGITREQWKLMGVLSLFWASLFGALGISSRSTPFISRRTLA